MHRIDAKVHGHRCQNRREHDDGGAGLDEHADQEQGGVDTEQKVGGRPQDLLQPVANRIGHTGARDEKGKQSGVGDDEHDHRAGHDRLAQDDEQVLELDFAVDQQAHGQRVEHRHGRGLGRGEDATVNTAQNDDRHQERPTGLQTGLAKTQTAVTIVLAPAHDPALDKDKKHQCAANQNAGTKA